MGVDRVQTDVVILITKLSPCPSVTSVVNRLLKPLAVIFDVDGVLVDSYDAHLRSWLMTAQELGVAYTEDDFIEGFGRTSREIIERSFGISDDEERIRGIDDRKEALYREIVAGDFPAMDGAVQLIDSLTASGFTLAMGSSGPPENLELALERLNRREAFSAVVSGRDVQRGKPDPEVFLLAAARLGVPPERCVVIEDAPAGIQAAQAGGMACVALLSRGRRASDFAVLQPNLVVRSLREMSPRQIQSLLDDD